MLIKFQQKEIINLIKTQNLISELKNRANSEILRWGGFFFDPRKQEILIEVVPFPESLKSRLKIFKELSAIKKKASEKEGSALIIPTGLGCSIGGFGGDANPFAKLLSSEVDFLIANPNVFNGGSWSEIQENNFYLEGFALDLFLRDLIALRKNLNNRIGLLIDRAIPDALIKRELEVLKAAKTIWGINFVGYQVTEEALKQRILVQKNSPKNFSSGTILNPEVLVEAAEKLVLYKDAQAIAILTLSPEDNQENSTDIKYQTGEGADPIGGLEAVCSHLISACFLLPCAHAPSFLNSDFNFQEKEKINIDRRVSPEITSFSFLPSILKGLSQAPQIIKKSDLELGDLTVKNLSSLVAPKDCLLGDSFLSSQKYENLVLYSVENNSTGIGLTAERLKLKAQKTKNFFELVGFLRAKKLALNLEI